MLVMESGLPGPTKRTVSNRETGCSWESEGKHRLGIGRDDLQSYAVLYSPDIPMVLGIGWGQCLAHRSAIPRNNCVAIQIWGKIVLIEDIKNFEKASDQGRTL
jgi:hypothetical protein